MQLKELSGLIDSIELLAPAGDFSSLHAAIDAKADAVYLGIPFLNMRTASAKNFSVKELPKAVKLCHENNVKCYVALNSIVYDSESKLLENLLKQIKNAGADAVIASDFSVILKAGELGLSVHISTQKSISNFDSVKFFSQFSDRIVLARELNLGQVQKIIERIEKEKILGVSGNLIEIECFAHGALCIAVSGRCQMSEFTSNKSANKGVCLQNCRRPYTITDDEGKQLKIDNEFILSPNDLCTIDFLDQLIGAGIKVLKIEGRGRTADYVFEVVSAYREALDLIKQNNYTLEKRRELYSRLEKVFNRGFTEGYYMGRPLDFWSKTYGSKATERKIYLGKVLNYYQKVNAAEILFETRGLEVNSVIAFIGNTTGYFRQKVEEIQVSNNFVSRIEKGKRAALKVLKTVRANDKVYLILPASEDLIQKSPFQIIEN